MERRSSRRSREFILPLSSLLPRLSFLLQLTYPRYFRSTQVNRYLSAAFCSWYSTGGSIPGVLAQLPEEELNITHGDSTSTGNMFEKFSSLSIDAAGGGGEYEVSFHRFESAEFRRESSMLISLALSSLSLFRRSSPDSDGPMVRLDFS